MSYGELDELSSRWARVLIGRGVGPESVVAVVVGRSVELVVGVWAVAKAGGAFLPVDPVLPLVRVREMLVDSGVVVGLSVSGCVVPDGVEWLWLDDSGVVEGCRGCGVGWGSGAAVEGGVCGVCDVYVGVDGAAEGGGGDA
nr:AMP-binding protein [Rhodococcus sp. USK13]